MIIVPSVIEMAHLCRVLHFQSIFAAQWKCDMIHPLENQHNFKSLTALPSLMFISSGRPQISKILVVAVISTNLGARARERAKVQVE